MYKDIKKATTCMVFLSNYLTACFGYGN